MEKFLNDDGNPCRYCNTYEDQMCECNLHVDYEGAPGLGVIIKRYKDGIRQTKRQMRAESIAYLHSNFRLASTSPTVVVERYTEGVDERSLEYHRHKDLPSQIPIKPMMPISNNPRESRVALNNQLQPLVKELTEMYFRRFGIVQIEGNPPLLQRLIDSMSFFSILYKPVYFKDQIYYRWCYTTNMLGVNKKIANFNEYATNTCRRDENFDRVRAFVDRALTLIADMVDNKEHYKTFKFEYNPEDLMKQVSPETSGGIRAGGAVYKIGDVYLVISGKKKIYDRSWTTRSA